MRRQVMARYGDRRLGAGAMVAVALLAVALGACGNNNAETRRPASGASFAGAVRGTEAFVGVVVDRDGRRVVGYLCDGKTVASWLRGGMAPDGTLELTASDGARLRGRITDGRLAGEVTPPGEGRSIAFEAQTVQAPAGLYRARGQAGGQPAVGGWVVLTDGSQRGAVRTSAGFIDQEGDLRRPSKPAPSFIDQESTL